jgi:uncharacterized protein
MRLPEKQLRLAILPETFAVCRLSEGSKLPEWALLGEFFSITRTAYELSIVCHQAGVPEGAQCERDWRCLQVEGPLDFSLTGILASLAVPLADAGISIFAVSTFDTDYLLVKEKQLQAAINALTAAGHRINS